MFNQLYRLAWLCFRKGANCPHLEGFNAGESLKRSGKIRICLVQICRSAHRRRCPEGQVENDPRQGFPGL